MSKLIDLAGQKFNKWTVLKRASNNNNREARWLCKCTCGKEVIIRGCDLRNGHSKGCRSCHVSRRNTMYIKHGQCKTYLYGVWQNMISRCENPNAQAYKNYGGRGISVCKEWRKDFAVFAAWALANGYEGGLTIDRIDNDKGYSPDNCQLITKSENSLKGWHVDGSHGKKYLKVS